MSPADFWDLKRLVHWDWLQQRLAKAHEMHMARCAGKHGFESWEQAQSTLRNKDHHHRGMRPYKCGDCGKYHVGTNIGGGTR